MRSEPPSSLETSCRHVRVTDLFEKEYLLMRQCPAAFVFRSDLRFRRDSPTTAGVETKDEGTVVILVWLTSTPDDSMKEDRLSSRCKLE
jgi:hypothetical protein